MDDFEFHELTIEFMTAYRQFLIYAYMHKDVSSEVYNKNKPTWDIIMRSLDLNSILGLAKIFYDKKETIGRPFDNSELDSIRDRILKIRHELIAHFNSGTLRDLNAFLERNQINGSEGLAIFEALKNRFLKFKESYKFKIDVISLFKNATNETVKDFNEWLKHFYKTNKK